MYFFTLLLLFWPAVARAETVPVTLFSRQDCSHCDDARNFLQQQDGIFLTEYKIESVAGREQFAAARHKYSLPALTPIILVRNQPVIGFNTPQDSGQQLQKMIADPSVAGTSNSTACASDSADDRFDESCAVPDSPWLLRLLGVTVDLTKWSLPVITLLVGLADGFNPCAMWALVALLGLLLNQPSRRRLLLIGGTFLLTSFLFSVIVLFGWLYAFNYINLLTAVSPAWLLTLRSLLAILAVAISYSLIRDALHPPLTCPVTHSSHQKNLLQKLSALIQNKGILLAAATAALLAIFVNFVELLCSVGLPVIYTNYLANLSLSFNQNGLLILLYSLFYMLDDFLLFAGALLLGRLMRVSPRLVKPVKLLLAGVLLVLVSGWLLAV